MSLLELAPLKTRVFDRLEGQLDYLNAQAWRRAEVVYGSGVFRCQVETQDGQILPAELSVSGGIGSVTLAIRHEDPRSLMPKEWPSANSDEFGYCDDQQAEPGMVWGCYVYPQGEVEPTQVEISRRPAKLARRGNIASPQDFVEALRQRTGGRLQVRPILPAV